MTGRALVVLLSSALIAVGLAGPAGATAAKHHHPTCARKGSHTVKRTHGARLFTASGKTVEGYRATVLYGCLASVGHKVELDQRYDDGNYVSATFSAVRLAGRYAAWHSSYSDSSCTKYDVCPPGTDGTSSKVRVFDLKRRRSVQAIDSGVVEPGLVLTQTGGVAWLAPAASGRTLFAADSAGRRTLDAGAIEPATLHAEISIVSWLRDGVERFARLR